MSDTFLGECKVCGIETDLINGVCEDCAIKSQNKDGETQCDVCGKMGKCNLIIAYGIETNACDGCRK